ncbi:MAG: hypothetical protein Q7T80_04370 [Methanoregula sp.]|nr:hypothetical protein [Methanoregula sp.]
MKGSLTKKEILVTEHDDPEIRARPDNPGEKIPIMLMRIELNYYDHFFIIGKKDDRDFLSY